MSYKQITVTVGGKERVIKLSDDLVFGNVMEKRDNCQTFLRAVLPDKKIRIIQDPHQQRRIKYYRDMQGIGLDVYAEDEDKRRYDIEMQVATEEDIFDRAQLYLSFLDSASREINHDSSRFTKSESIVIFIYEFDPVGEDRKYYRYRFREDESREEIPSSNQIIFINTKGTKGEITKDLAEFIGVINEDYDTDSPFAMSIIEDMENLSDNPIWRQRYMRYIEKMQQREKVAAEKAAMQSKLDDIKSVMKKLNYSSKEACDFLDIPQDQQIEYINALKQSN